MSKYILIFSCYQELDVRLFNIGSFQSGNFSKIRFVSDHGLPYFEDVGKIVRESFEIITSRKNVHSAKGKATLTKFRSMTRRM